MQTWRNHNTIKMKVKKYARQLAQVYCSSHHQLKRIYACETVTSSH